MQRVMLAMVIAAFTVSCSEGGSPAASLPTSASVQEIIAVVDIATIAGKSEADVGLVLGEPLSCEDVSQGKKCLYQQGDTEIVYISGKADWITIEALDVAPYSDMALSYIGLTASPPTFSNEFVKRWSGISGLLEVSIFPAPSSVDYAYIKVITP